MREKPFFIANDLDLDLLISNLSLIYWGPGSYVSNKFEITRLSNFEKVDSTDRETD